MTVAKRMSGFGLTLAMTLAAWTLAQAQPAPTAKPAAATENAVTYQDVLQLVQGGKPEQEILDHLEKSAIATTFTLGDKQVEELKQAGASETLIAALKQRWQANRIGDISDLAIILDCSGSMNDKTKDGSSKMVAAKQAVTDLLQDIPNGRRVAFIVYGHDVKRACEAVDVIRPLSEFDDVGRDHLKQYVSKLQPAGGTPIAKSLEAAGEVLAKAKGLSKIVLVTDGLETCKGNPVAVAEKLAKDLNTQVEVIGFGLKPEENKAVAEIARAGRGKFYGSQTMAELKRDLTVAATRKEPPPAVETAPVVNGLPAAKKVYLTKPGEDHQLVRLFHIQSADKYGQDMVVAPGKYMLFIDPAEGGRPEAIAEDIEVEAGKVIVVE